MKRVAEQQLTKDGGDVDDDDDDNDGQEPARGLQKADESVLVKRQIRALPKRSLIGLGAPSKPSTPDSLSNGAALSAEPSAAPKFDGFGGFKPATATSFTFTPPAPSAFAPLPSSTTSPSPSPFSASARPPALPQSQSPFGHPLVSASASPATKTFASAFGSSAPSTTPSFSASTATADEDAALKYYKSLRGLNISFLSAISKVVDQDPFVDVGGFLESYKKLRIAAQNDFDESSKSVKTPSDALSSANSAISSTFTSSQDISIPPPKPVISPPVPPTSFAGFAPLSTNLTSSSGGFTPKLDSTSASKTSAFSFSNPPPPPQSGYTNSPTTSTTSSAAPSVFNMSRSNSENDDTPKPTSNPFASSTPTSEPPKSVFGSSDTKTEAASPMSVFGAKKSEDSKTSGFIFGSQPSSNASNSSSPFGSPAVPNFFASSKAPSTAFDSAPKPVSVFGSSSSTSTSSPFGSTTSVFGSGSPETFRFSGSKADGNKTDQKPSSTSPFGGSNTSAFNFSTPPSTSPFGGFGGNPAASKPSPFGFGKGSIGNPVGFGFGSGSSTSNSADAATSVFAQPSSAFSFGEPPSRSEGTVSPPAENSGTSTPGEAAEGADEDSSKLLPTTNHDEEGEGEEDEETVHAVKCKVYKMAKTEERSEWKDIGVGVLRLKKHKETDARRVLLRNSSNGKITINFKIYAGLKPTLQSKFVSFVGHDNGASTTFKLRFKTDEQASELKSALDREIADVKGSDS